MALRSFVEIAPDSHFPLENLPFGVFKPRGGRPRVGVAIGEYVVDLSILEEGGHFKRLLAETAPTKQDRDVFSRRSLNAFLALGRPAWRATREALQHLLDGVPLEELVGAPFDWQPGWTFKL